MYLCDSAHEPYLQKFHISAKEPDISTKEPYISAKKAYISAKVTYLSISMHVP